MKKVIVFFVAIVILIGIAGVSAYIFREDDEAKREAPLPFQDILPGDWYFEYVSTAYEKKWIKGTGNGMFSPEKPMTRGEFAVVIYRYLGQRPVAGFKNPFVDVTQPDQIHAVMYLNKLGLLEGKDETHFAPNELITREAAVTILYRMGGYKVHEELSPSGKFMDWERINLWARDAMDWAVSCGFIEGTTSTILSPQAPITRAQLAKILCLYAEKAGGKTETMEPDRQVTIRLWHAGVDHSDTALIMRQLLNSFEKENPGITVEYTPMPSGDAPYQTIANAIEKGNAPDILIVSAPYETVLADRGDILPLDTLLSKDAMTDIHGGLLLDCYYNRDANPELRGRLVSVPLTASPAALLMNRDLLKHFSISYPTGEYGYGRMLVDANFLTGNKDGEIIYGYGARSNSPAQYLSLLWSKDQNVVEPRSRTAGTSTKQWREQSQVFSGIYQEEVTPDYAVSMDYYSLLTMFAEGSVSMMGGSLEAVKLLSSRSEWEDKLLVYSYTDDAEDAALCVGQVAVIPSATKYVVEAACVIDYLLRSENQYSYHRKTGELPAVLSAIDMSALRNNSTYAPYVHGLEDTLRMGEKSLEIYSLIAQKLQSYLRGEIDEESYIKTLTEELDLLLGNKKE